MAAGAPFLAKGFMPPRPSGHLTLGSPPFELKSPDEYPLLIRDDQPKANAAAAGGRVAVAAVRRAAIPAVAVAAPAAPTKHPIRPRSRTGGIRLGIGRIIAIPIAAPLTYIAMHVKQSPSVRSITAHRSGLSIRLIKICLT